MVEKLTLNSLTTALVDKHSCSQHANCILPQLETTVSLCCVTKLHILVAFYCPEHKVHLYNECAV
jgi:hypothetical protein